MSSVPGQRVWLHRRAGGPNRTTEALERAFTGTNRSLTDEVLFSSALKWSAVAFNDGPDAGVYVFGAPEAVRALLGDDRDLVSHEEMVKRWTSRGLRVLLLAGRRGAVSLHDGSDSVTLPPDLAPLALICMSDELRPKVQETLDGFRRVLETNVVAPMLSPAERKTEFPPAADFSLTTVQAKLRPAFFKLNA